MSNGKLSQLRKQRSDDPVRSISVTKVETRITYGENYKLV